ncbi:zinc finger protein 568-like isoform X1 [Cydia pomonella]|uniref:zinc finger protein 568-like isoform X1 n=1 Tax=Cydia pomonella TaxID=82600 RepID=UPI002ADDC92F|nr:zinc finger protein 568-like isoform X1 [Cydia pomonella]
MPLETVRIKQEDVTNEPELITVEIEPKIYPEPKLKELVKQEPVWDQDESEGGYVEPEINEKVLPGTVTDNRSKVKVKVEHVKGGVVEREEDTSCDEDEDVQSNQKDDTRYETYIKVIPGAEYDKKYACQLCDYRGSRFATRQHTKCHVRRLTCPKCHEIITDTKLLEAHVKQAHPDLIQSILSCESCNIMFTNITKLKRHEKYAHNLFQCTFCSEKITKKGLIKHLRDYHENDLPACELCGFKFTCKSKVIRHKKLVHLKEKNVTCEMCNFKCFDVWDLKRHMVSHDGKKSYECRFCSKKFARRTNCALHEKIHTGEKNKVCAECGAAFVQKASLNYHMSKYHPDS